MKGRILVVDDEAIVLTSCDRTLAPEGYTVRTAVSGKEALGLLEKEDYDLIITDIKMPEMDGIEFMQQVRSKNPAIAIVVITGYPSQESIREALSLRIVDYLPKPFSPALLLEVVQKAMEVRTRGIVPEAAVEDYTEETAGRLDAIIGKHRNRRGSLIPVLQEAQELVGYLPPTVQRYIAKGLRIPVSEVYGVVSFYSFFSMKPRGRHTIKVCLGTACYATGAEEIVKRIEDGLAMDGKGITGDRKFSLETVRCLGACGLAPVVVVDKDTHGSVTPVKALEILRDYE
ncbi:MAG: NAD(P)H-dependent oxidoreductase subunit E [Thermodesulfovibrionales bacterium]|jgi:NADH:ubiquinone oxidoreductase subunit E/CheY-like chemotaxis protein